MFADVTTNLSWFFLVIALIGWALYGLANIRKSRAEIGSEIKLAANRKPYYDDEILEGKKIERTQLIGIAFLARSSRRCKKWMGPSLRIMGQPSV
jgi:hypothetical protein